MATYWKGAIVYWDAEWKEYKGEIVDIYTEDYKMDGEDEFRTATVEEPSYIVELEDTKRYIVDNRILNHDKSWNS